ncbi:sigma-K factor [Mycobacterium phage Phlei]|uniref:DNA binding protein n=1 Tax=Mycobacterium phage Phlei TaxID=1690684 RepID=A0A0N9BDR2_9CAUD|nr:sigma-K factor [Mycobacterium phage Phlei]ALA48157.1 hypothetical protein [Mycobacterium phage Phlei]
MSPKDYELEDAYLRIRSTIKRAARSVAYQWPGVIDAEDVVQEIATRLWEHPESLLKIADMEPKAQYRAIVGMGHQIAKIERDRYDHFKCSYRYSVDEVKRVLNKGVLVKDVKGFDEAVFDLMEALEFLVVKTPQYADAILARYADGEDPTSSAEKKMLSRALTSLANAMNASNRRRKAQRDDGPGSRKAITNAQAHTISSSQYDGEDADWSEANRVERSMGIGFGAGGWK